jgi:hypothetical protein
VKTTVPPSIRGLVITRSPLPGRFMYQPSWDCQSILLLVVVRTGKETVCPWLLVYV